MRTKDRICTFGNLIDPRDYRTCTIPTKNCQYDGIYVQIPGTSQVNFWDFIPAYLYQNIGFIESVIFLPYDTSFDVQFIIDDKGFCAYNVRYAEEIPIKAVMPCSFYISNANQEAKRANALLKYIPNDIYREYLDQLDENDMEPDVTA